MRRLTLAMLAGTAFAGLANAADLPTKKAVEAPPPKPNCWASLWTWMNSSPDDCPIGAYGITLYGTLDVGYGYQDWGTTKNPSADKVNYGIQKSGHEHIWQSVYNGISTSVVGLKMKEDLAPIGLTGWSLVGVLEAGVNPYSGVFTNPVRSLADNNVNAANGQVKINGKTYWRYQTANFDSSRNGSWDNSQGYAGISHKTWGTLTFGRTNSLSNDTQSKYDPISGSQAFSLIGFSSSFPGFGDTQLARINTALTYKVAIPSVWAFSAVRLAGQAQIGGYGVQNGSNGAYYGQVGFDWGNLSFDGVVGWAKDAVSLSSFGGSNIAQCYGNWYIKVNNVCYDPNAVLKATLSNNFGTELMASYKWDAFKFYGGYIYARLSNPSDQYLTGFRTNYPEIIVPPGYFNKGVYVNDAITTNPYTFNKVLQTVWTGVRLTVPDAWLHGWGSLELAAAFYYQWQNNYNFTVNKYGAAVSAACTGSGPGISSSKCYGTQDAVSFFADWKPVKRVDIYAGIMISNVYGGLANGFITTNPYFNPVTKQVAIAQHAITQNYDPTIGIRIRF